MGEGVEKGRRKEAAKLLSTASSASSNMSYPDNSLRRHQTRAAPQPSVSQRLSDILRNRRLRIGRSKTTTASSLSDSLTLSESTNSRGGTLYRTSSTNSYQSAKSGFSFKSNRSNMTTLTTVSSLSGSSNTSGGHHRNKRGDTQVTTQYLPHPQASSCEPPSMKRKFLTVTSASMRRSSTP